MRIGFTKVLVVEHDEALRSALTRALQEYGVPHVVGAADLAVARARLDTETDLVLASVIVGGQACTPLLDRVQAMRSGALVVALNGGAPAPLVFRLGRRPEVAAMLEKPVARRVLWTCLDSLSDLEQAVPILHTARERPHPPCEGRDSLEGYLEVIGCTYRLTSAELDVLRCALEGMGRAQIALQRGVTHNTLKTQIRSLLAKFSAPSLDSLAARVRHDAMRAGIPERTRHHA